MSEFGEGLAEIGQGTLAARSVEPLAGEGEGERVSDGHTHERACLNCGTGLVGSHCHACGQAAHVHRTLGAFFHDLVHGVFHFEGKIWRTLPLLAWHPGRLTREYIDGRRASYVSPIALFLFFVFLMFAVFHATQDSAELPTGTTLGNIDGAISEQANKVKRFQTQRKERIAARQSTDAIDERIEAEQEDLDTLRGLKADGVGTFDTERTISDLPAIDRAIKTFRANPALAAYKAQTYPYKYSWALIPISVPFVWLLFPFSRRFHLYDHTVFVTYSMCFMALLFTLAMILGAIGAGAVAGLFSFLPPFHMYRQLKGTYGLSRGGALWRTALLVLFATTALFLFFALLLAQTGGA